MGGLVWFGAHGGVDDVTCGNVGICGGIGACSSISACSGIGACSGISACGSVGGGRCLAFWNFNIVLGAGTPYCLQPCEEVVCLPNVSFQLDHLNGKSAVIERVPFIGTLHEVCFSLFDVLLCNTG